MQHRTLVAAAAAALVAVVATGCNILTPQATTIEYDAADGISGTTGQVEIHNAVLVGEEGGDALNLVVTFTNPGQATFLEVRVEDDAQQIRIPEGVTSYGTDEQLVFPASEIAFGSQQNVSFQADGAEPVGLGVQVFPTDHIGYEELGPGATTE